MLEENRPKSARPPANRENKNNSNYGVIMPRASPRRFDRQADQSVNKSSANRKKSPGGSTIFERLHEESKIK